jgi:hypothetical protein
LRRRREAVAGLLPSAFKHAVLKYGRARWLLPRSGGPNG